MYRLMVVDDEELIRQGLIARLKYLGFSFEEVLEAEGGREALRLLEEIPVDIVITDIRMPDLDGFHFIEMAQKIREDTQYILLSGYAEFAYAEKAISLGVSAYLLKPLSNEELSEALRKCMGRLKENARQRDMERFVRSQRDYLLDKEINALVNEKNPGENKSRYPNLQERYPELFMRTEGKKVIMLGILKISSDSYGQGSFGKGDVELVRFSVRNVFQEIADASANAGASTGTNASVGEKIIADSLTSMEQMLVIFVGADAHSLRDEAERVLLKLFTLFEKKLDVYLTLGMSTARDTLDIRSRREAEEALKWGKARDRFSLCFYEDRSMPEANSFPTAELNFLELCMERRDLEGMRKGIRQIFAEQLNNRYSTRYIHMILSRILNMVLLSFPDSAGREDRVENLLTGLELDDDITDIDGLTEKIYNVLLAFIGEDVQEANAEDKIRMAILYMQQNFDRNIVINELAERYGMSSNYFSTMFKKETNQSAIAYLTNLRVQKAAWYLENTEESVADISHRIGYEDSQYFFRVFKKAMGMTPLMYRKQHRRDAD